jgi:hypothetical protein
MRIPTVIRQHPFVTVLVLLVTMPVVVATLWTAISISYTYAEGERAGVLLKISKRGWVCKTWEGELQYNAMPGAAPEKFVFSVRSDSIANELRRLAGQRVVLHYQQHRGVPGSCFGDTEYYIAGVHATGSP